MILADGVVDGDVALEGDADRHEDGGAHRDELRGEEYVGEEDGVGVRVDAEGAAERLEDHAEEVPRVEADERDQQQVEGIPHLVPARGWMAFM